LDHLKEFLERYRIKKYKKGDVILQQDADPASAFAVKKGIIKTYNLTSKGEEKPIGFHSAGELFPLGWIFGKIHKAQYYYEALSDCQLYSAPKDELTTFIQGDPEAMYEVLNRCVWEALNHEMRINALGQSKASDKVLHTIHYLALYFGRDLRRDIVEIPLPLTQQDVANFTGLTRETVSVELKKLASQKILFYRNRSYVVLTDKLNVLLDDGYEQQLVR
jgi:CRP/FNR family transcriptional regulator